MLAMPLIKNKFHNFNLREDIKQRMANLN